MKQACSGIVLNVKAGTIKQGFKSGPLAGASARVDSGGGIDRRLSATRVVATGGLGLFWKKKVDHRESFLTIDGQGFSFVAKVNPKHNERARKFAAKINAAATQPGTPLPAAPVPSTPTPPSPPQPSTPAAWYPDPHKRFELRYHDGIRWTEHVSTGGGQSVDPA